ncbi:hypothetical protein M422DRAFT_84058, partial [Sphaerobolus stellatus SS14]
GAFDCLDCDLEGLFCASCLNSTHTWLSFHRPRKWRDGQFHKCSLADLGYLLALEHGGNPCPYIDDELGPQTLTIADLTGIHEVIVGWCRCASAPSTVQQLFRRRLFPASMSRPRTAFTFRLLKLFHMLNHVARTTPWDFVGTLHRLTDNVN